MVLPLFIKKSTWSAWSLPILRLVTGLVLITHGFPKLFGSATAKAGLILFFQSTVLPAPSVMVVVAGILECVGGLLLILGLFTAYTTAVLALEFIVIILFVELMKGFGAMELDLFVLASLFVLNAQGSGEMSVDAMMVKNDKGLSNGGQGNEAMGG